MASPSAGTGGYADTTNISNSAAASAADSRGEDYFNSYTNLHVHEVMLRDWPRMAAYRRFFEENSHLVEGKTVMDVGAGTGILSLFAASVGARKVYAVEASATAGLCREIVEQNGFSDRIEVIHSTVEDLQLGDEEKVDIIVSEWMGFYLLHESMLDSVIVARDRFLAEDGIMAPALARLHLAPVNMESFLEDKYEFWTNVCGFDFSPAIPHVQHQLLREPVTTELSPQQVLSPPLIVREFDLKTVTVPEVQSFSQRLVFEMKKSATVHGLALWFDVDFQRRKINSSVQSTATQHGEVAGKSNSLAQSEVTKLEELAAPLGAANSSSSVITDWTVVPPSVLSTSPISPVTHWKQTVILLPRALAVDSDQTVACQVCLTQDHKNKRHYNIELALVDDTDDDEDDDEDGEEEDDVDDHPVPCDCSHAKCRLIKALMEKYDQEQDALETEAEIMDLTAEVEAAKTVGQEMEEDGSINTSEGP